MALWKGIKVNSCFSFLLQVARPDCWVHFPQRRAGAPGCWTARGAAAAGLAPSRIVLGALPLLLPELEAPAQLLLMLLLARVTLLQLSG